MVRRYKMYGEASFKCFMAAASTPITFIADDNYLKVTGLDTGGSLRVALDFRTFQPGGLLFWTVLGSEGISLGHDPSLLAPSFMHLLLPIHTRICYLILLDLWILDIFEFTFIGSFACLRLDWNKSKFCSWKSFWFLCEAVHDVFESYVIYMFGALRTWYWFFSNVNSI